jgi:hypothetical protein
MLKRHPLVPLPARPPPPHRPVPRRCPGGSSTARPVAPRIATSGQHPMHREPAAKRPPSGGAAAKSLLACRATQPPAVPPAGRRHRMSRGIRPARPASARPPRRTTARPHTPEQANAHHGWNPTQCEMRRSRDGAGRALRCGAACPGRHNAHQNPIHQSSARPPGATCGRQRRFMPRPLAPEALAREPRQSTATLDLQDKTPYTRVPACVRAPALRPASTARGGAARTPCTRAGRPVRPRQPRDAPLAAGADAPAAPSRQRSRRQAQAARYPRPRERFRCATSTCG